MDLHLESCSLSKNRNVIDITINNTAPKINDNYKPTSFNETRPTSTLNEHDKHTINVKQTPSPCPEFVISVANKINENVVNDKFNNQNNDFASTMQGIYGNIVLCLFGYNLSVSIVSYNVLDKRESEYYCGLCHVISAEKHIVNHVHEITHVELLQRTPFLTEFSCNLVRYVSIFVAFFY